MRTTEIEHHCSLCQTLTITFKLSDSNTPHVTSRRASLVLINTKKTLKVLSLLRPIVRWHIKNSKKYLISSSPPLGRKCNRSHISCMAQWRTRRNQIFFAVLCVSCVIKQWVITVIKLLRFFVLIFAMFLPDLIFLYYCGLYVRPPDADNC